MALAVDKFAPHESSEDIEGLLDPVLADIQLLLEEHKAQVLGLIAKKMCSALRDKERLMVEQLLPKENEGLKEGNASQGEPTDAQRALKSSGENTTAAAQAEDKTSLRKNESQMTLEERDLHERELASKVHAETSFTQGMVEILEPSRWSRRAMHIVSSRSFEMTIAIIILLNSIFIGIEVEVTKDDFNNEKHSIFFIGQIFFCLTFTSELTLRLLAEGLRFFTSSDDLIWNYIDLAIVVSSVCELIIHIVILSMNSDGIDNDMRAISNIRVMRILRVTRLLRALRMARVVRFVRDLRLLVGSILSTLYALVWSMLLLLMIIYIFAILFTEEAAEYLHDKSVDGFEVHRFFGSLDEAIFTLFKSISGGLDWDEPVSALGKISKFTVYLFTAFVGFVYFAVLNVVTGVFCTSAIESNLRDRENLVHMQIRNEKVWQKNMADVFKSLDHDHSNAITIHEFESGLRDSRMKAYLASLELDPDDAWTLFKLLDSDKTQSIDIDEFVMGCLRLRGQAKSIDVALLMYDTRSMARRQELFMEQVEKQLASLSANDAYIMRKITSTTI